MTTIASSSTDSRITNLSSSPSATPSTPTSSSASAPSTSPISSPTPTETPGPDRSTVSASKTGKFDWTFLDGKGFVPPTANTFETADGRVVKWWQQPCRSGSGQSTYTYAFSVRGRKKGDDHDADGITQSDLEEYLPGNDCVVTQLREQVMAHCLDGCLHRRAIAIVISRQTNIDCIDCRALECC